MVYPRTSLAEGGTSGEWELLMTSDVDHRLLEVRLLGPIEARVDGVHVSISGPRRRALLVRLALSANEVVSTDQLIDDMWGVDPPPTAAKALHVHVSQLRQILNPGGVLSAKSDEAIVTRSSGYLLRLNRELLDTWRLEDLFSEARRALEQHRHAEAAAICRDALSLWRGPALVGVTEDFAVAEIARLEELRLAVIEMRLEADLAQQGHVEVIGELETLVARHPFREHLWWLLALALYRSGRHAEALRACTRLREVLREELGLDPSLEIITLEHQIIVQDPMLEVDARIASQRAAQLEESDAPSEAHARRAVARTCRATPRRSSAASGGWKRSPNSSVSAASSRSPALGESARHERRPSSVTNILLSFPRACSSSISPRSPMAPPSSARWPRRCRSCPSAAGPPLDTIVGWIADRRVLLVLDNCEHLVTEVGALVEELIDRCWNVQILATSREALRVRGERVHRVPSLDLRGPAVELFCDRAAATDTSFATNGHDDALVQICQRLDGIPLAIELAAARVQVAVARRAPATLARPLSPAVSQRTRRTRATSDVAGDGVVVLPAAHRR